MEVLVDSLTPLRSFEVAFVLKALIPSQEAANPTSLAGLAQDFEVVREGLAAPSECLVR